MFTKTIKGIIRGGKIEPAEEIDAPEGTEVVISVPQAAAKPGRMITFGMFSGPPEQMATEEDFREARRSIWGDADAQ